MVDIDRILKNISDKGDIRIGVKETKQMISKGLARLVIVSNNNPHREEINKLASEKNIPVYNYPYTGIDLGYACGKNYAVSTLCLLENIEPKIIKQLINQGKNNA
ncbi:MAG: ribosomal L7Ae/L30e/S12e/Gadd45 family protein [Candidatus Thermoplasmatota archaeon]